MWQSRAESVTLAPVPDLVRVALFHPALVHGGIQRVFVNLARGFHERGLQVDLVQATPGGDFRSAVPSGIRLVDLNARRALTSIPALVRYLRRERPHVLISGAIQTNVAAALARRIAAVPTRLIITEHSSISAVKQIATTARGRFSDYFVHHFYPWADAVVAISQDVADDLSRVAGLRPQSIRVIPTPLLTPELLEKAHRPVEHPWFGPGEPPVVLSAGRLNVAKDYPTLVRAFHRMRPTRPSRLVLLGEGEELGRLQSLICELGLEKDVLLPGSVLNPHPYMAAAGVFVLSSTSEGLPAVLVEALAVGCPVVSTDSGSGVRDILGNGALGRIVPVGDVARLAEAILAALKEPRQPIPPDALKRFDYLAVADLYRKLMESLAPRG